MVSKLESVNNEVATSCRDLHEARNTLVRSIRMMLQIHRYDVTLLELLNESCDVRRVRNSNEVRFKERLGFLVKEISVIRQKFNSRR